MAERRGHAPGAASTPATEVKATVNQVGALRRSYRRLVLYFTALAMLSAWGLGALCYWYTNADILAVE